MLACGREHSLVIDINGCVWGFGNQLGLVNNIGQVDPMPIPQQIKLGTTVVAVSASENYSIFLDFNGSVWACGDSIRFQYGLGYDQPALFKKIPQIKAISAGWYHSILLDIHGMAWSMGFNSFGQLGLEDAASRTQPQPINYLPPILEIAAGQYHTIFLDFQGCVWTCGENQSGQLGVGADLSRKVRPTKIESLPIIVAVAAGSQHSSFLDFHGNVWMCGSNGEGRLGLGDTVERHTPEKITTLPKIKAISIRSSSLFLDCEGGVWGCGFNGDGRLGLGPGQEVVLAPRKIDLPVIQNICSGGRHSLFQDYQGFLWSCGDNACGQLGLGDVIARSNPQLVKIQRTVLPQPTTFRQQLKHLFILLAKEPTIPLMHHFINSPLFGKLKESGFLSQLFELDAIPLMDWSNKKQSCLQNLQQLLSVIRVTQESFRADQNHHEVSHTLLLLESRKEMLEFFCYLLESIGRAELEFFVSQRKKFEDLSMLTVNDVIMFLKLSGLAPIIPLVSEVYITGKQLLLLSSVNAFGELGLKDPLLEKKLEFNWKLLEYHVYFNREKLEDSEIYRCCCDIENTIQFMARKRIPLDPVDISEKNALLSQLIFFETRHIRRVFGLNSITSATIAAQLRELRKEFIRYLKTVGHASVY